MMKVSLPRVSILDRRFRYTPSYMHLDPAATVLHETFLRVRLEMAENAKRNRRKAK